MFIWLSLSINPTMGVHQLWSILEPVKQHRPLKELRGQVLAVDLSIWIVESKNHQQMKVVLKPHLRYVMMHYYLIRMTELLVK